MGDEIYEPKKKERTSFLREETDKADINSYSNSIITPN